MPTRESVIKKMINKNKRYPWYIFAGCCALSILIVGLILSTMGLFFSFVSDSLELNMTQVALIISCTSAAFSVGMLFAGKLLRIFNIRMTLSFFVFVSGGGMTLCSVFTSAFPFYIVWACIGISAAFLTGMSIPVLLGNWFEKHTSTAIGITTGIAGIGGAFFNFAISRVIAAVGWRTAYLVAGILVMLVLLPFTLFIVERTPEGDKKPFGYDADMIDSSVDDKCAIDNQCNKRDVYKSFPFYAILIADVAATGIAGFHQLIPSHIVSAGFNIIMAGNIMSGVLLGLAGGNVSMGALLDRFGPIRAIIIGCGLGCTGWIGLATMRYQGLLFLSALMVGFGQSVIQVGIPCVLRYIYGNAQYVQVYGIIVGIGGIGCITSPFIGGFLFDRLGSYTILLFCLASLYIFTAMCIVSAIKYSRSDK